MSLTFVEKFVILGFLSPRATATSKTCLKMATQKQIKQKSKRQMVTYEGRKYCRMLSLTMFILYKRTNRNWTSDPERKPNMRV